MTPTHTKKKVSFLSIALGSLVVTSLSTGSAEALPFSCTIQCTKTFVGNDKDKVNKCAEKCKNINIMNVLRPNAALLNEANKTHFLDALRFQQSLKKKEHTKIEGQLSTETKKKNPSKSNITKLSTKNDELIKEINELGTEIENLEKTLKAPERPAHGPRLSQEGVNPSHSGAHISEPPKDMPPQLDEHPSPSHSGAHSKPPSDMPPQLDEHPSLSHSGAHSKPPSDMPPVYKEEATHEHPTQKDEPMPQVQKGGNIPTPPKFGENPREILKADIQAQNPGKKAHEINALVKQHLDAQYPGKSPGDINQALKEHYEGKHPGKSHAEILAAVQAGGGQTSSAGPIATPPETTGGASPQVQKKAVTGQGGSITEDLAKFGGLKKRDDEAEAKRMAAAKEKLENNPKANPSGQSGNLMGDLQKAMKARRGAIKPKDEHDEPETDEDWNTH